jgi:hypothetical protein
MGKGRHARVSRSDGFRRSRRRRLRWLRGEPPIRRADECPVRVVLDSTWGETTLDCGYDRDEWSVAIAVRPAQTRDRWVRADGLTLELALTEMEKELGPALNGRPCSLPRLSHRVTGPSSGGDSRIMKSRAPRSAARRGPDRVTGPGGHRAGRGAFADLEMIRAASPAIVPGSRSGPAPVSEQAARTALGGQVRRTGSADRFGRHRAGGRNGHGVLAGRRT